MNFNGRRGIQQHQRMTLSNLSSFKLRPEPETVECIVKTLVARQWRLPRHVSWPSDGPSRTYYGPGAAGLLRLHMGSATSKTTRTALCVGPPGHPTRWAAGLRYAPGRYAPGRRAVLRAGPRAAPHARSTTSPPHRWIFGPADGRRRYIPIEIEAPRPQSLPADS
jgi:hypothetical protein